MTTDPELYPGSRISLAQARRIVHQRLAGLPRCAFLRETDFVQLMDRLFARRYSAGAVILTKGVCGDCLGVITEGQIACYSPVSRDHPVMLLLPGSTFGEAMLVDGQPSETTLRVVTDAQVLYLRRADFLAVVGQRRERLVSAVSRWLGRLAALVTALIVVGVLLATWPVRETLALVPYTAGLWLGQRGSTDQAEVILAWTRRLAPDWGMPYMSLGNLYLDRGRFDQAEAAFEQALVLTSDMAEAYNGLGLLYSAREDYAAANEAFAHALALEPGQATVVGNLAFCLQLAGEQATALQRYALARALDTPDAVRSANEALLHYQAGDLATARSVALEALRLDDTSVLAYVVLGAVYLEQGEPEAAAFALRAAIKRDPTYVPAHFYLGLAAKLMDQPEIAISAFERVLDLNPDPVAQSEARKHLVELYGNGPNSGRRHS